MSTKDSYTNTTDKPYDRLLTELRSKLSASVKDFVPRLYQALRDEGLEPKDARDKIEKDLVDIANIMTIREALPEEAKSKQQRNAGKQRHNSEKSAGLTPAPDSKETIQKKQIELLVDGKPNNSSEAECDVAVRPFTAADADVVVNSQPDTQEQQKNEMESDKDDPIMKSKEKVVPLEQYQEVVQAVKELESQLIRMEQEKKVIAEQLDKSIASERATMSQLQQQKSRAPEPATATAMDISNLQYIPLQVSRKIKMRIDAAISTERPILYAIIKQGLITELEYQKPE